MVLIREMSDHQLRRAQSEIALDRARASLNWRELRPIRRSLSETRVTRVYSVPDFSIVRTRYQADPTALWLDYRYRPRYSRYHLDDYDDWWYWRGRDLSYPFYPSMYDRYYNYFPWRTWSRLDYLDPYAWRRYRDPYYTRPLYSGYRPWAWESYDADRAVRMYRSGLISYDALDKYWLSPYTTYRRSDDWRGYGYGYGYYPFSSIHYNYPYSSTSSLYYPYSYHSRPFYYSRYLPYL